MITSDGDKARVELSVEVAARPETVWRCVSGSELLSRWLAAKAEIDPHVGGAVRIDFGRHATVVEGVVEAVQENHRLVFSWGISDGTDKELMPPGSTRVSIELVEIPGGTRVTLTHAGLPNEKSGRDHSLGWNGYLANLAGLAAIAAIDGTPEELFDRWFAAWAETDSARRAALLRQCAAEEVTYTDIHAATTDRTQLSEWMAVCQGFFPNVRVVRNGSVLNCRGALLVRWRAEGPQGEVFATGTNTARLTTEGRLRSITAFWEP